MGNFRFTQRVSRWNSLSTPPSSLPPSFLPSPFLPPPTSARCGDGRHTVLGPTARSLGPRVVKVVRVFDRDERIPSLIARKKQ